MSSEQYEKLNELFKGLNTNSQEIPQRLQNCCGGGMQEQTQGFPMISVMPPGMQNMMGIRYPAQISHGTMTMQGRMPMGPMQGTAASFMGQPSFIGMHHPAPQYSMEMQKQFAEEQQKRFEQQQKMFEEERKRRQFEEQKQKLRMLSSVKPKTGEKSKDDALEAIKGNLDFFSRDAKMHPPPVLHTKPTGGIFPAPNTMTPKLPSWIHNDNLVPEFYKNILETTMTATGIDTAKLYPILMSSGLPRETLGQIWALANRTMPGKLAKEELYIVLAMIAIAQRGGPAPNLDVLTQIPSAPIPVLSGFPVALPTPSNQLHMMSTGPALTLTPVQQATVMNKSSVAGETASNLLNTFTPSFLAHKPVKLEDDDFQDFQDAFKTGPLNVPSDFQSDISINKKPQIHNSKKLIMPISGTAVPSASVDKYAVFKEITMEKPSDNTSTFEGESFANFKSSSAEGSIDTKASDSILTSDLSADMANFLSPSPIIPLPQKTTGQHKPLINASDIDPFSLAVTSTTFNHPLPTTIPLLRPATSNVHFVSSTDTVSSMTSTVSCEFGDFALCEASSGSQNDFADFRAFNNDNSVLEQDFEDKYKSFNTVQSTSSMQSYTATTAQAKHHTTSSVTNNYDTPKPYCLNNSSLMHDDIKDIVFPARDHSFADSLAEKVSVMENSNERSFVDKIAAFKQNREDSASIKSLDLPSISGSSIGKEDSEDALSLQFDIKLPETEGNLKHVMSDGYLDLQSSGGQSLSLADMDDFKGGNNQLESNDWFEKDFILNQHCSTSDLAVLQEKVSSFGDPTAAISKMNTFTNESFFKEGKSTIKPLEELNEDFFNKKEEDVSALSLEQDTKSHEKPSICIAPEDKNSSDFGEFQREKTKISKFDFLMATSQGKVKSSEEMIKNELATLDLCAQGSHKRSLSLGDKDINPALLSAPEKPRDRSNTLSEKPALPVIRDKYKDLTGEVEESERYVYEWQRCLESALKIIAKANDTLNGISSSSVCTEVIQSAQGMEYLLGVVEVYRVTKRVELGIKATAVCSEKLQLLLKEIDKLWNNLIGFMSLASLMPDESALDFSSCMLRPGIKNAPELACGVCLLNVDSRSKKEENPALEHPRKAFNSKNDNFKLSYGGHQYHTSCANFWINCVQPKPPGLLLPNLL
ncbi:synergin gamma isoform X2 [Xenopus laevis]|uniref:Synergin gamma isoform X2 n=1 Tax=Xenopus laevis TaxID=8355 RepID=A0A8J1MA03_XENLA|nr:synergin gamma isoform X2 [Xenopus laevis]